MIYAARNGHESTLKLLLERPDVKINTAGKDGQTALIAAAKNGRDRIVQRLLGRKEIQVNTVDRKGQTALILAARSGRERIVKLLLERGDTDLDAGAWDQHVNTIAMGTADHPTQFRRSMATAPLQRHQPWRSRRRRTNT